MRLLAEGQLDVIGTTPGGMQLRNNSATLNQLQVLAVLNRSNGADLVLHRPFRRTIRNPAQKPRAAFTGGSTSELLFRAFARSQSGCDRIEPVAVRGYLAAAQALLRDHRIQYVSTWEPYGSLLRDIDPSLQIVAATSRDGFDLVADYLVGMRERTGRALLDAMAVLLGVWDRVVTAREYLEPKFVEQFSRDCAISTKACRDMLGLVSFFTTREMASRMQRQVFLKQYENVARIVDDSTSDPCARWRDLLEPIPPWFRFTKSPKRQ